MVADAKQIPATKELNEAQIYLKLVYGIAPHLYLPVDEALEIFRKFQNSPFERERIRATKDMDEAEIYLKRVYGIGPHSFLPVEEALEIFKKFKNSPVERERKILSCVLEIVYEQHLFIKGYPEKKLATIGHLFGGIIEYDLLSSCPGLADNVLSIILNALKAAPGHKMYTFGITALNRFKCRLKHLYQYCSDISKIPHYKQLPRHLIQYVEYGMNSQEPRQSSRDTDFAVANEMVAPLNPVVSAHSYIPQTTTSSATTTTLPIYELIDTNVASPSTIRATKDMDEAEIYLKRVYGIGPHSFLPVEEALEIFKKFKNSPVEHERKILSCVLEIVYEQHLFIKGYPEKKLATIGHLFGGIIEYDLLSSCPGLADNVLSIILNALKAAPGHKMYTFGITALNRFKCRLKHLYQYCSDISKIPHYKQLPRHLIQYVEYGMNSQEPTQSSRDTDFAVANEMVAPQNPVVSAHSHIPQTTTSSATTTTLPIYELIDTNVASPSTRKVEDIDITNFYSLRAAIELGKTYIKPGVDVVYRITYIFDPNNYQNECEEYNEKSQQPTQSSGDTDFSTLFENDETIIKPTVDVQNRIDFIFNNLSAENFQSKSQEIRRIISEKCLPWLSRYLLTKRVSMQNNSHTLYLNFLEYSNSEYLNSLVVSDTYKIIRALLEMCQKTARLSDKSSLYNFGHWLGKMTFAKNRPISLDELNLKTLLEESLKKGHQELQFTVSFVIRILYSCSTSTIFTPRNPIITSLLYGLHEICKKPNLKSSIKSVIEQLFGHLNIELKDIKPKNSKYVFNFGDIAMKFDDHYQRLLSKKGVFKPRRSTASNYSRSHT